VLLVDPDVGDGTLAADLGKSSLNVGAVVDLVQLNGVDLGVEGGEQLLGGSAVGAVGLGEDGCAREKSINVSLVSLKRRHKSARKMGAVASKSRTYQQRCRQ
jgi:hypothetical protein